MEDHGKLVAILSVVIFILTEVCLFTCYFYVFIKDYRKRKMLKELDLPMTDMYQEDDIVFEDNMEDDIITDSPVKTINPKPLDRIIKYIKDTIYSSLKDKIYLTFQLSAFIFILYTLFKLKIPKNPLKYTGKWSLQNPIFRFFKVVYELFNGSKDIAKYIPPETSKNVFLGYTGICVILLLIGIHQLYIKRYIWSVIHLFFSVISFVTIMMMTFSDRYEIRWHHMSYGLLLTITNLNSLTLFGSYFVFDSIGYWFESTSGSDYGYDNIIEKYTISILVSLLFCSLFQILSTYILKKLRQKYKMVETKKINNTTYFAVQAEN